MQIINTRNFLYLHSRKAFIVLFLLVGFLSRAQQEGEKRINLQNYNNRWVHYGFVFGIQTTRFVTKYSPLFVTSEMDTVHSIVPGVKGGFKLGFITEMKINRHISFRGSLLFSHFTNSLTFRYTNGLSLTQIKESNAIEIPLMLKFTSDRRRNLAVYGVFGITPSIEASGESGDRENLNEVFPIKTWGLNVEVGAGLDLFFPFFKFSPEVRFSYGLFDLLPERQTEFNKGLERVVLHSVTFYFSFEGGPSDKHKEKKKKGKKSKRTPVIVNTLY